MNATNLTRKTLPPPAGYAATVARSRNVLTATLPVDERSYAALRAIRSQIVREMYDETTPSNVFGAQ